MQLGSLSSAALLVCPGCERGDRTVWTQEEGEGGRGADANPKVLKNKKGRTEDDCLTDATNDAASKTAAAAIRRTGGEEEVKKDGRGRRLEGWEREKVKKGRRRGRRFLKV